MTATRQARLISLAAAAYHLDISPESARKLAQTGAIVRDHDDRPVVRVVRIGGRWKVPIADLDDLVNPDERGEVIIPMRVRGNHAKSARNAEMVAAFVDGASAADLAARYAITHQRVYQIVGAFNPDATTERRRVAADERERIRLWHKTKQCRVCAAWFLTSRQRMVCSSACARAWRIGRRYFDPEFYDRLRKHQGRTTHQPNRRFIVPTSEVVEALIAVGRNDLLPPHRDTHCHPLPRCEATTKAGTSCLRHVHPGHELCHIHEGLRDGRPINGGRNGWTGPLIARS